MSTPATSGSSDTEDYKLVLKAIQYLEREQPPEFSVNELAQALDITPERWKQVIDRWVGRQPKCYLRHLVQDCRNHLLMNEFADLNMNNCKLSLPRRQQDAVVTWMAMTLKQYKAQFGSPVLRYGWFVSPFGEVLSLGTEQGLCEMVFCEKVGRSKAFAVIEKHWPNVKPIEDPDTINSWTRAAFEGGEVPLERLAVNENRA